MTARSRHGSHSGWCNLYTAHLTLRSRTPTSGWSYAFIPAAAVVCESVEHVGMAVGMGVMWLILRHIPPRSMRRICSRLLHAACRPNGRHLPTATYPKYLSSLRFRNGYPDVGAMRLYILSRKMETPQCPRRRSTSTLSSDSAS